MSRAGHRPQVGQYNCPNTASTYFKYTLPQTNPNLLNRPFLTQPPPPAQDIPDSYHNTPDLLPAYLVNRIDDPKLEIRNNQILPRYHEPIERKRPVRPFRTTQETQLRCCRTFDNLHEHKTPPRPSDKHLLHFPARYATTSISASSVRTRFKIHSCRKLPRVSSTRDTITLRIVEPERFRAS